jgi:hypothetical protein
VLLLLPVFLRRDTGGVLRRAGGQQQLDLHNAVAHRYGAEEQQHLEAARDRSDNLLFRL